MTDAKEVLIEFMRGLDIIDCHEHLPSEPDRIARTIDVLALVSLYEYVDATSAGYKPRPGENLFVNNLFLDTSVPLEERWRMAWPHLQNIRFGSYFRASQIALRDLYGIDALNEKTYLEATERMRAANKPGLYAWVLREKCRIKTCLVQNGLVEHQVPPELLTPVYVSLSAYQLSDMNYISNLESKHNTVLSTLDAYLEFWGAQLAEAHQKGAVGCKIAAGHYLPANLDAARTSFDAYRKGAAADPVLQSALLDFLLRRAGEWDWPVPVHCGIWGDYRLMDPKLMIDTVVRYPNVRFDLYHLGMPSARDCIFMAKNFPNVSLDLCWCYVISQEIARQAINEIIDTVPVNKVHGFGGDYIWAVENVYGHLAMARETLAEALADRMARGRIDLDGAQHILTLWLHDNPQRFYNLSV